MNRNTVNITLTILFVIIALIASIKSIDRTDTMNMQLDNQRRIHNLEIKVSDMLNRIDALEIKINNLNKSFNAVELQLNGPVYYNSQKGGKIKVGDNQ